MTNELTQGPLEGAMAFELRQMTAQRDHWLEVAREKDEEIGRLTRERDEACNKLSALHEGAVPVEPSAHPTTLSPCCGCRCDGSPLQIQRCHEAIARELSPSEAASFDKALARSPRRVVHSTEDDFRHFLSYEKLSGQPGDELARLRLAYYAGADAPRPAQQQGPQQDGLTSPSGPRLAWNDDPKNLALNDRSPQKSTVQRCFGCGAVVEPGSPRYCSAACAERT